MDNVQPVGLVAAAAVALLAIGLPVSGGKTFGDVRTRLPSVSDEAMGMVRVLFGIFEHVHDSMLLTGSGAEQGEAAATVSRKGKKFHLGVGELNALLRL